MPTITTAKKPPDLKVEKYSLTTADRSTILEVLGLKTAPETERTSKLSCLEDKISHSRHRVRWAKDTPQKTHLRSEMKKIATVARELSGLLSFGRLSYPAMTALRLSGIYGLSDTLALLAEHARGAEENTSGHRGQGKQNSAVASEKRGQLKGLIDYSTSLAGRKVSQKDLCTLKKIYSCAISG